MMRPPTIGTTITHGPSVCIAGDAGAKLKRWKKKTLVKNAIRARSATATYALMIPIGMATSESNNTRALAVKSPSACRALSSSCAARAPRSNIYSDYIKRVRREP